MTPKEARMGAVRSPPGEEPESAAMTQDLQEENRLRAVQNLAKYHKETKAWGDKKLKSGAFTTGNMVLHRRRDADFLGKFESKWEGPFLITAMPRSGAYGLMFPDGEEDPHTWNADLLMRYYP